MFRDLFLVRAWKQSKGIFLFILIFSGLQLLFNLKRMQTFPFLVWDMYSRHLDVPESGSIVVFYLDGKRFDHTRLPIWKEETAEHTFSLYRQLKAHPGIDPLDELVKHRTRYFPEPVYRFAKKRIENEEAGLASYPDWLFYYLREITQTYFRKLEVKEVYYQYKNGEFRETGKAYTHLVVQHD